MSFKGHQQSYSSQLLLVQSQLTYMFLCCTQKSCKHWIGTNFFFLLFLLFKFNCLVFLKNFYWSIADFQWCVSYRCTAKWISYTYTYIHSLLDSFPIQAITEYWVEFPVLYSRSLLVIYFIYSSVYVSIRISQFIPPFPPATISLFSTSVTLFVFCK